MIIDCSLGIESVSLIIRIGSNGAVEKSQDKPRIQNHRMCELQIANLGPHAGKFDKYG